MVTLTASNFDDLVLGSEEPWMIEFYAPWCGHCKNLAPEWAEAAETLEGDVKVGAVDATVHEALAQRFSIRGFPTIKFFPAGARGDNEAEDYNGQRDAGSIAQYATGKAGASAAATKVEELVSPDAFASKCKGKRKCVVAFLPHIANEGKDARNRRIGTIEKVAKQVRSPHLRFLWSAEGQQPEMERFLGVEGNTPAVVALSKERNAFVSYRGAFDQAGIASFVNGLGTGRVRLRLSKGSNLPAVKAVQPWDGEDAPVEEEEDDLDLNDLLGDEL